MNLLELVLGGILVLLGVRSFVHWYGVRLDTSSAKEQLLFTLSVASRVGLWFAFAGFFVGYALVNEIGWINWYVFVLIGLAGLQLLTTVLLARGPARPPDRAEPPGRD